MNNKEIPEDTVGGKPSYEAQKLRETFIFCKQLLANPKIDDGEKKTMEFYLEQLKEIKPCADENKFRRPCKGIGGTGDTQVFKPYVVRDRQTKKPLLDAQGNLVVIKCVFIKSEFKYFTHGRATSVLPCVKPSLASSEVRSALCSTGRYPVLARIFVLCE